MINVLKEWWRPIAALWTKEMRSYFQSPIAYGVIVVFLIFTAFWFLFINVFVAQNQATLRGLFTIFPVVFIVLIPALTMRIWSEENRQGSAELLYTLPIPPSSLVLGKFLAVSTVTTLMILLTLPLALTAMSFGEFEIGQVFGDYLSSILLALAAGAIGMFASSLVPHQITAFLIGVLMLLLLTLANLMANTLGLPEFLSALLRWFSLEFRFSQLQRGVIDTRDVFFFVWLTVLFLYLNTKSLVLRKAG